MDNLNTAYSGMIKMPEATKAWWICRACHLVDWIASSEDGRFALIRLENSPSELRVDLDDVFDTNLKALDAIRDIEDYWKNVRRKMQSLI